MKISSGTFAARHFLMCAAMLLLLSCASLDPDYEQPTVTLTSFRALPSEGMAPAFEVGLNILNPNTSPLHLQGVAYSISIQGHDVVKGVGRDFPVIEGYSEETIKLKAQANLFAGIRLIMDMVKNTNEALEYEFEAKLDTGGLGRSIRVREKGSFRMDGRNSVPQQDISGKAAAPRGKA